MAAYLQRCEQGYHKWRVYANKPTANNVYKNHTSSSYISNVKCKTVVTAYETECSYISFTLNTRFTSKVVHKA